ncbi:MAG: IS3 family transposase, partial [Streptococcaceae bacterium]|nr:IS3 family transposase [Streptococcaceae bacterium]
FPKATYFYWKSRFERSNPDEALEHALLEIRENHANYGYRRMIQVLKQTGWTVNHKKVQRLMKKLGLLVVSFWRKSRKYSSYRGTVGRIARNLVHRRFNSSVPHQKITTDTTEFKYYEKGEQHKLYLNPYLDLFNNEILSFEISQAPTYQAVSNALNKALDITSDCPYRRTFHSDQGWVYQMPQYHAELKNHRIFQSMSRKGNCHDNSVMENFFGLLKQEIYYGHVFHSFSSLKAEIVTYIHYYNTLRIKEKLGWKSPVDYRLNYQNK